MDKLLKSTLTILFIALFLSCSKDSHAQDSIAPAKSIQSGTVKGSNLNSQDTLKGFWEFHLVAPNRF